MSAVTHRYALRSQGPTAPSEEALSSATPAQVSSSAPSSLALRVGQFVAGGGVIAATLYSAATWSSGAALAHGKEWTWWAAADRYIASNWLRFIPFARSFTRLHSEGSLAYAEGYTKLALTLGALACLTLATGHLYHRYIKAGHGKLQF